MAAYGDFAEERMSVGVVNNDRQRMANLAWVAFENDNPVAMGAAGELERAVGLSAAEVGNQILTALANSSSPQV